MKSIPNYKEISKRNFIFKNLEPLHIDRFHSTRGSRPYYFPHSTHSPSPPQVLDVGQPHDVWGENYIRIDHLLYQHKSLRIYKL